MWEGTWNMNTTTREQTINKQLEDLRKSYVSYVKYIHELQLLRAILGKNDGYGKTWEELLLATLDTLNERESKVLKLRFGLDNGLPMTLEEVGKFFGVTRERIRQMEGKAIRKLRHPSRKRVLLGESWQMAIQDAQETGVKLLTERNDIKKKEIQLDKHFIIEPVESMGLPTRVANALIKGGYLDTYQLVAVKDEDLLKCRGIGNKGLKMVRSLMTERYNSNP